MSTIKSSAENLTLNADGANNDIKFQSNGVEVASIDQAGTITATTFTGAATDATKLPLAGGTMTGDLLITKSSGDVSLTLYASENSGAREPILNLKGYATNSNPVINFGDHAGYAGAIEYENQDNSMRLWTNASEKVRIHSNGVTSVPNGIELGSGTDATAANTLDDYEEGTWTPACIAFTITNTDHAKYTKIGRMVNWSMYINASSGSTAGAIITGLPFTCEKYTMQCNINSSSANATMTNPHFRIPPNSTQMYALKNNDSGVVGNELDGSHIIASGTYMTA